MEAEKLFGEVKDNIEKVLIEIQNAAHEAGRNPAEIKLMAVTKTKPAEYVRAAYAAGIRLFGENRVQEMEEKYTMFEKDARIHLIGHLQRNKARKAAAVADSVDSIDKYETALELDRQCALLSKKIDVLLEYNTSGEESKSGFSSEKELFDTAGKILGLGNIRIRGLMTIAPFTDDEKEIRKSFRMLASLFNKLRNVCPPDDIDTLSMGMSSDFRIAIEEGSTIIRIGTRLFGGRT